MTEVSPGHTATVCRKVESDQATCGITLRSEVTESVQNAQALQNVKKNQYSFPVFTRVTETLACSDLGGSFIKLSVPSV